MIDLLMRVRAPGAARSDTQEMTEEYVAQWEKAIKTGKKADLPQTLKTKLEDQRRAREKQALGKATNPTKTAGTEHTPSNKTFTSTRINAKATEQNEKERASAAEEMKKGEREGKQNQSKNNHKFWRFHQMKNRTLSW